MQATNGRLRVQLQDETGRACEGFGDEDCEPIGEDTVDEVVKWKGGDVRSLEGKMVALKFTFSPEVRLYSYTLES